MKKIPVTEPDKAMPFRLLRYFTLISLVSIVVASIVLGAWFRTISVENLVSSEERNNVALAHFMSQSVWSKYSKFLQSASALSVEELRAHRVTKEIDEYLAEQFKGLGILKIKIYDVNGYTVFSSDVSQIGDSKKERPSLESAIKGRVASKMSFRDKFYAREELISNLNIVASYIPIRHSAATPVEGVFEVYKDVTPLVHEIKQTHYDVIIGVSGILAILFLVLFFVIRHADNIIQKFNRAQQKSKEKMEHQAYHDSLTGLPNRLLLLDRLEHAIELAKRDERLLGVMFIDLDHFKSINDNLGHDKGDMVICEVAKRISECLRPTDTVARLSGDEFMVVLEGLRTIDRITEIAKRIVYSIGKPVDFGDETAIVTCSVGISVYPFDEEDSATSLIKKADTAMYDAKQRGRNNYVYFIGDMAKKKGNANFSIESDLHQALENNEFRVFFQPKVNLNNWKMQSMEALARWEHASEGIVLPGKFISVLEETGLIDKLGESILHQSCEYSRKWQDEGLAPLKVAVNVSALQFKRNDFVETVEKILLDTCLPPKHLELELTESCLIDDVDTNVEILNALKARGIGITIDDFGTGYSSLSYLCKLPVSTLKIDRSFVMNLNNSKEHRSIITAIISFAHGLKMDIVAEGVETIEELTFLNAMRCTTIQGFLFSKPLPVAEFETLYRSGGDFSYLLDSIRKNGKQQAS